MSEIILLLNILRENKEYNELLKRITLNLESNKQNTLKNKVEK